MVLRCQNLLPTILFSLYFIWKIDRTITCFLLAGYMIVFLVTNLLLKGLYQIKEKIKIQINLIPEFGRRIFVYIVHSIIDQKNDAIKQNPIAAD